MGHSMGAIGAILAGAADPRVAAVVATSAPADPYRLTRQTFHLAHLPIPDPIAYPLAWLTTRVYLSPRGHTVGEINATKAIARYRGPILLAHGDADQVVPFGHMGRLAGAARSSRGTGDAPVETLAIAGGQHSWLYEEPAYRAAVARFLTTALGGPLDPDEAARLAAATHGRAHPGRGDAVRRGCGNAGRLPDARPGRHAGRHAGAGAERRRDRDLASPGGRRARTRMSDVATTTPSGTRSGRGA